MTTKKQPPRLTITYTDGDFSHSVDITDIDGDGAPEVKAEYRWRGHAFATPRIELDVGQGALWLWRKIVGFFGGR